MGRENWQGGRAHMPGISMTPKMHTQNPLADIQKTCVDKTQGSCQGGGTVICLSWTSFQTAG